MPQDFDPDAWMAKQKKGGGTVKAVSNFDPDAWMAKQAKPQQPQPAQPQPAQPQGQSMWETFKSGAAEGLNEYILAPSLSLYETGREAARGNFRPAAEMAESAARGGLGLQAALLGGPGLYRPAAKTQERAIQRLQTEREARRANDPLFEDYNIARAQLAREAAANPSFRHRAARFVGTGAVAAAPALLTGAVSGGSIPAIAAVTALQSAGQPETASINAALGAAPLPVGRAVGAIVRRLRGRGAPLPRPAVQTGVLTGAVADQAAIRAKAAQSSRPASGVGLQQATALPRYEAPSELPRIYETAPKPFGVRENLRAPAEYPGASGPGLEEFGYRVPSQPKAAQVAEP